MVAGVMLAANFSCGSDDGCEGNQSSLPLAGFYSSQVKTQIAIDSLTIYGIGMPGDTTIVDTAFRYDQSALAAFRLSDTVTIKYKSLPYFHSEDCGAMLVYDIEDYATTHYLIDSVVIPVRHIDNADRENIQIYFRTSTTGEEDGAEE